MLDRLFITPYKMGSASAKSLAQSLNCKRTKAEKRLRRNTTLINWGRSDMTPRSRFPIKIINTPVAVAKAANKLKTFQHLLDAEVSVPEFTTSKATAQEWLEAGDVVYARTKLNGNSGQGLIVCSSEDNNTLPNAPMYVKGIVKSHEYRVHIFNGQVIDFTKKRRRNGHDESNTSPYIKNLDNGWVFCREGIELPEAVANTAIEAVSALGLDFGAVDIVSKRDVPFVIEVNTAPGLQGTTLSKYQEAFANMMGG